MCHNYSALLNIYILRPRRKIQEKIFKLTSPYQMVELAQNSLIILLRCCPFVYTRHTQADVHSSEAHLSWIIRVPFQINRCLPDSAPFGWNRGYTTVIPKLNISESPETFVKNVDSGISLLIFWFLISGEQFYIFNRHPLFLDTDDQWTVFWDMLT